MNHPSPIRRARAWAPLSLSLLAFACAAAEKPQGATMAVAAAPVAAPVLVAPVLAAVPGEDGIGDPLFPKAGNGGYDVQSCELAIAMDSVGGPIDASALIRAKSTQALSRFNFDLHALEVRSVEVDGASATFARDGDELMITPAKPLRDGAEFTALVRYGGVPEGVDDQTLPFGMDIGWVSKNGEIYVFSEPTGAKSFMPCNDHPRDKALYTLRITVPKPLIVAANGTLAETLDGDAKRTFVFRPRDPIASYLVTICIAEFEVSEVEGPNGMKIRNYFAPKTGANVKKSFQKSGEVMKFLGDTFGPYPFESCGNIVASLPIPGALETQTLPLYGAGVGDKSIICHEQAHQWFGDTVSVTNWQDIWLNEGFAEYASWMYLESSSGREAFEKQVKRQYAAQRSASDRRVRAAEGDGASQDKPRRRADPPGKPSVRSMFSSTVYIRGALCLHALRTEVGDEKFLALMRSWVEKHRNANATVEDFLSHVEQATSPAARAVLEHWVLDEEMPHVAALDDQIAKDKAEREAKRKEKKDG